MRKLINILVIVASLSIVKTYGAQDTQRQVVEVHANDIDSKNVLARVKNMVIVRTYDSSFFGADVNDRSCYLEAFDIETGKLIWRHKNTGMIVSFINVDDDKIIYRHYNKLTAIDVNNGNVVWSIKTKGQYSTIQGE